MSLLCGDGYVFLFDRVLATGVTQVADSDGIDSGGFGSEIYSEDGSTLAWIASVRENADIETFDTTTGAIAHINPSQSGVYIDSLGLSANGRRIAYVGGIGIGNGPEDFEAMGPLTVYSYNRTTRVVRYLSAPLSGPATEASDDCDSPTLSADGTTAAFVCRADNIVEGDGNARSDVFARALAGTPRPDLQARISVADASITEPASGSTNAQLTITLDRPPQLDSRLEAYFVDGTATSPGDYDGRKQAIFIDAGQTSATVSVPVYADTLAEGDETFVVRVRVSYGDIARGPHADATVTIHDFTP
jgi:hypothetical protein